MPLLLAQARHDADDGSAGIPLLSRFARRLGPAEGGIDDPVGIQVSRAHPIAAHRVRHEHATVGLIAHPVVERFEESIPESSQPAGSLIARRELAGDDRRHARAPGGDSAVDVGVQAVGLDDIRREPAEQARELPDEGGVLPALGIQVVHGYVEAVELIADLGGAVPVDADAHGEPASVDGARQREKIVVDPVKQPHVLPDVQNLDHDLASVISCRASAPRPSRCRR